MGEGGVESEAAGQGRDFPRSLNGKINRAIRCDHKSQEGVNKLKKKVGGQTDRQTCTQRARVTFTPPSQSEPQLESWFSRDGG